MAGSVGRTTQLYATLPKLALTTGRELPPQLVDILPRHSVHELCPSHSNMFILSHSHSRLLQIQKAAVYFLQKSVRLHHQCAREGPPRVIQGCCMQVQRCSQSGRKNLEVLDVLVESTNDGDGGRRERQATPRGTSPSGIGGR